MTLRTQARGKPCTLNFVGACNFDMETTVLAHVKKIGGGEGMGRKGDDRAGVYACSDCHDVLDRRAGHWEEYERDRWFYIARALYRTRVIQEASK